MVLCGFVFLLAAAVSQHVNYPAPVCAVRGSSVSLLCTFTPQKSFLQDGDVLVEITRVLWCQNHEICHGTTPSVYDSEENNNNNNPRYRYLGDKKGNCSLQITDVRMEDFATLRFRMEADEQGASFTGPPGVRVTVVEGTQMKIRSSSDGAFKRGGAVTLNCTTTCTFHHLEVTWYRDGHALHFTGPALHLGTLTAKDSGNYTCGLKNNDRTLSSPHVLFVEEEQEEGEEQQAGGQVSLVVGVVFGVLLALCSLVLVLCIIRRKRAADKSQSAVREEAGLKIFTGIFLSVSDTQDDIGSSPKRIRARSQTRWRTGPNVNNPCQSRPEWRSSATGRRGRRQLRPHKDQSQEPDQTGDGGGRHHLQLRGWSSLRSRDLRAHRTGSASGSGVVSLLSL
ncbi:purine nucleoside phosphorylase 4b isoform X3 [Cyclopterus lumpus]|uniref:purine nucleoside phosphorylase 4b isoform X3 n=1 Tax=Cyclopterus lumpus TaxID=8103 RepID=UPI00148648E3|nr:purine nucleoside phosphorylase 4b isoform X3 [Cyclopterus lumpus]